MRGAVAGGSEGGVVGQRRRGDVKQRDGGEEEEQQERRRRQDGASGARARVVVVGPAPPRQDHLGSGGWRFQGRKRVPRRRRRGSCRGDSGDMRAGPTDQLCV